MALLPLLQLALAARGGSATGSLAVVDATMRAGQMAPLHAHAEDEALAVLDGTLTVWTGDDEVTLSAGQTYVVPAGTPHTHRAESRVVRYLAATFATSIGRYEDFVRAVASPGALGSSAAGLHALAHATGTTVLGAPGALPAGAAASVA